jgi:hypothetical protein
MKTFLATLSSVVLLCALCVSPLQAGSVNNQAATTTTRAAVINKGILAADGTITATATGTGGTSTVTLSKPLGVITTGAITTAAAADHVMTVTATGVTSASVIQVTVNKNGSTGWPVITSVEPGTDSYVIRITNAHASAAFNAALKLMVHIVKY